VVLISAALGAERQGCLPAAGTFGNTRCTLSSARGRRAAPLFRTEPHQLGASFLQRAEQRLTLIRRLGRARARFHPAERRAEGLLCGAQLAWIGALRLALEPLVQALERARRHLLGQRAVPQPQTQRQVGVLLARERLDHVVHGTIVGARDQHEVIAHHPALHQRTRLLDQLMRHQIQDHAGLARAGRPLHGGKRRAQRMLQSRALAAGERRARPAPEAHSLAPRGRAPAQVRSERSPRAQPAVFEQLLRLLQVALHVPGRAAALAGHDQRDRKRAMPRADLAQPPHQQTLQPIEPGGGIARWRARLHGFALADDAGLQQLAQRAHLLRSRERGLTLQQGTERVQLVTTHAQRLAQQLQVHEERRRAVRSLPRLADLDLRRQSGHGRATTLVRLGHLETLLGAPPAQLDRKTQ
jgi:hypothetical protein